MMALADLIRQEITLRGPVSVARFMELALSHPQQGYYMTRDPFGGGGDFITAPEISQVFGEMIGFWALDLWQKMGAPARVHLVELGPGRGTLMKDLLRIGQQVPEFSAACEVHLVETSPALREMQRGALAGAPVFWHADLSDLPTDAPLIVIANEFFDALPIRQIVHDAAGWSEIVIGLDAAGQFMPGRVPLLDPELIALLELRRAGRTDLLLEHSSLAHQIVSDLSGRLNRQGGGALIIDYGSADPMDGSSLQALHHHAKVGPFDKIGESDLTVWVDFSDLSGVARAAGAFVFGPVTQRDFLQSLGVSAWGARLSERASPAQQVDLLSGIKRLVDPAQMGTLFKVLALCRSSSFQPAGFGDAGT